MIHGNDQHVVEQKAIAQKATWNAQWATLASQNILKTPYSVPSVIEPDTEEDTRPFSTPRTREPVELVLRREPRRADSKYQTEYTLLERLFRSLRRPKDQEAHRRFEMDHVTWRAEETRLLKKVDELGREYDEKLRRWESERDQFLAAQRARNEAIRKQNAGLAKLRAIRSEYFSGCRSGILNHCAMVLGKSEYSETFPRENDLDYIPETKTLICNYSLPNPDAIPKIKEVKYVQSTDRFSEVLLAEGAFRKLYDDVLLQICLRSILELYTADVIKALESIVFNGWVRSIDRATGKEVNACILSVQTNRAEFLAINFAHVEPKACFRNLKGVGSSQLHGLVPIAPILNISREDKRFVPSHEVADALGEGENLAAMDWEDFEHLIREIFAKEFAQDGGDVKVTRASRDGGVDAVAFDPDPIRGGKIVIQAKRYTNPVGVSAVRDLYGTVVNEGATKGILVSTADYGPDAYEFAKDKPLSLLNGSNLLHLLAKHGYKAKIDLKEAKRIIAEREREGTSP